jgi:hypothetical protein
MAGAMAMTTMMTTMGKVDDNNGRDINNGEWTTIN